MNKNSILKLISYTLFALVVMSNLTACSTKEKIKAKQENPLVMQAKELQTGSEKVGIDNFKAIELLKKASEEGDAEAMYLLAQYYAKTASYRYLPENNTLYESWLLKAAYAGSYDAIDLIFLQADGEKLFGLKSSRKQDLINLRKIIKEHAENGEIEAMLRMSDVVDHGSSSRFFNLEHCKWLYKGFQAGDIYNAGRSLQYCKDNDLEEIGAPSQKELTAQYKVNITNKIKQLHVLSNKGDIHAKQELLDLAQSNNAFNLDENMLITKQEKEELNEEIENFYLSQGERGFSDAYLFLAKDIISSDEKNIYLEYAAKMNNRIALSEIGDYLLYSDNAVEVKKGMKYLLKAVELNDPQAMNNLGIWFENKDNKDRDIKKSLTYYKRSAHLGSILAMENLASSNDPEKYQWAIEAYKNGSLDISVLKVALVAYQQGLGSVKQNTMLAQKVEQLLKQQQVNEQIVDEKMGSKNNTSNF